MAAMKLGGYSAVSLLYGLAFILAILGAVWPAMLPTGITSVILLVMGIIAGLVAISMEERMPVMIASGLLAVVSGVFAMLPWVGSFLTAFLVGITAFTGPIFVITALLVIWDSRK